MPARRVVNLGRNWITPPAMSGTVRLSSKGKGASSTTPATTAPRTRTHWKVVTSQNTKETTTSSEAPTNARVPTGDFPEILGPRIGRPTKAATGSPRARKNRTTAATGLVKQQEREECPNEHVCDAGDSLLFFPLQHEAEPLNEAPVHRGRMDPCQVQRQAGSGHNSHQDQGKRNGKIQGDDRDSRSARCMQEPPWPGRRFLCCGTDVSATVHRGTV